MFSNTEDQEKFIYYIFDKSQDFIVKINYEFSKVYINKLKLYENIHLSMSTSCQDIPAMMNVEQMLFKYLKISSDCMLFIKLNKRRDAIFVQFKNLKNVIKISALGVEAYTNPLILSLENLVPLINMRHIKKITCSKNFYILSNFIPENNSFAYKILKHKYYNNTIALKSLNFTNEFLQTYKYEILISQAVNYTDDFLVLEHLSDVKNSNIKNFYHYNITDDDNNPSTTTGSRNNNKLYFKAFSYLKSDFLNNKFFVGQNNSDIGDNKNIDLDFIYNYISCNVCMVNGICGKIYSNILELKNNRTAILESLGNHTNTNDSGSQNNIKNNLSENNNYNNSNNNTNSTSSISDSSLINNSNNDTDAPNALNTTKTYSNNNSQSNNSSNETDTANVIAPDQVNNKSSIFVDKNNNINKINDISSNILCNLNLSYYIDVKEARADLQTIPAKNLINLTNIEDKLSVLETNTAILEQLSYNMTLRAEERIKESINANLILSNINCTAEQAASDEELCIAKKQTSQQKILGLLSTSFNCSNLKENLSNEKNKFTPSIINNELFDEKNFIGSVFSIYFSTLNIESFSEKNIELINEINKCLLIIAPDIIASMNSKKKAIKPAISTNSSGISNSNHSLFDQIQTSFVSLVSSSFSNMVNIAMINNKNILNSGLNNSDKYDDYKNNSLILTEANKKIKQNIEKNALLLMTLFAKQGESAFTEKENKRETRGLNNYNNFSAENDTSNNSYGADEIVSLYNASVNQNDKDDIHKLNKYNSTVDQLYTYEKAIKTENLLFFMKKGKKFISFIFYLDINNMKISKIP